MEKITIQRTINAPIQKVWDYYTQPEHITKWNFADVSWHCPSSSNDLSVGGKMLARMEAKDGSFGFDFEGTYDEVEFNQSLVYTMPDKRNVRVTFEENGNQTHVTVVFDAENMNPVEMQRQGWQSILNNFSNYVETN